MVAFDCFRCGSITLYFRSQQKSIVLAEKRDKSAFSSMEALIWLKSILRHGFLRNKHNKRLKHFLSKDLTNLSSKFTKFQEHLFPLFTKKNSKMDSIHSETSASVQLNYLRRHLWIYSALKLYKVSLLKIILNKLKAHRNLIMQTAGSCHCIYPDSRKINLKFKCTMQII